MAAKFEIEKFNGNNFSLWKLKMKAILRKDKCLAAIGERPAEVTDDSKRDEMDGNAVANLHFALADGVLSSIEEKRSANDIWDHLARLYEARSLHNKFFLKRKLYALRMVESTSVTEHGNVASTLKDGNALCCEAAVANESGKIFVDVWLFDTGATFHMTARREWFHQYKPISGGRSVKQHRLKFKTSNSEIVYLGSRFGSFDGVASTGFILGGAKYFVSSLIEYSSRVVVYQSRRSLMCLKFSKVYKARVELDSGKKIKCLRTDNGGEYTGDEFDTFCRQEGIKRQFTTASISQQNGDKLYHFNCRVELKDTDGNVAGKQGWRVRLDERKGVIACGDPLPTSSTSAEMLSYGKTKIQRKIKKRTQQRWNENRHESKAKHTRTLNHERRRLVWQADYVMESNVAYCLLTKDGEPSTLQEALNNPDASFWKEAMQEEIEALHKNKTWELVPLLGGRKPIGNKWV
ncbi:gag-pol polyprotein [Tanacetum coccineum]